MSNGSQEFTNPGTENPEGSQTDSNPSFEEFDPPTTEQSVQAQAEQDLGEALADVDSDLISLKQEIEKKKRTISFNTVHYSPTAPPFLKIGLTNGIATIGRQSIHTNAIASLAFAGTMNVVIIT